MSQALMTQEITRTEVEDFLYYQARLLDDRHFEEWIECFTEDAEYWMTAWDDDGKLTEDPQTEISLIYYPNRAAWKTASSASAPSVPLQPLCQTHALVTTSPTWKSWNVAR